VWWEEVGRGGGTMKKRKTFVVCPKKKFKKNKSTQRFDIYGLRSPAMRLQTQKMRGI
jgi:hypothetical protein